MVASATGVISNLGVAAAGTGLEKNSNILTFIGGIIKVIIGLLGVALAVVLIYGGIMWGFLARGDAAQIKKAKEMIINAIIGLVIVFISYAITTYVFTALNTASSVTPTTTSQ